MAQMMLFSGSSLQQAVLAAARHFGLDAEELAYRVRDQRQGLGRGRQRILVEVDPAAPRKEARAVPPLESRPAAPRAAAAVSERRPEAPVRREEPGESSPLPAARISLAELPPATGPEAEAVLTAVQHLASLAGIRLEAKILQGREGLHVDVGEAGRSKLVAEDASLLQALEQLLPRAVRGLNGGPVALTIDAGGVREQMLEDLRRLALATADRVRNSGQPETLAEMTPAERRIVHMTLAEDSGVSTESLGSGSIKRVQVRPR